MEEYYVLYKKNFFTRWKYVRNNTKIITFWKTKKGAESYIHQEKNRMGLTN
jgi:hypothetical protein